MPSLNTTKHDEATDASWEATRGAVAGALKWGVASALLGGLGWVASPVYRGLTIQFKVFVSPLFLFFSLSLYGLSGLLLVVVLGLNWTGLMGLLFCRYLQMSGMVLGSMLEADSRLRQYEARMRVQRRLQKEQAYWASVEREFGKDDDE